MEKNKIGFTGTKYKEYSLEDHLGGWILVHVGEANYVGKLVSLANNHVHLLPYQKISPKDNGVLIQEIGGEKPHSFRREDIRGYREYSEKEAKNFCKNLNDKFHIEWLEQQLKISALEKQLKHIKELEKQKEKRTA